MTTFYEFIKIEKISLFLGLYVLNFSLYYCCSKSGNFVKQNVGAAPCAARKSETRLYEMGNHHALRVTPTIFKKFGEEGLFEMYLCLSVFICVQ